MIRAVSFPSTDAALAQLAASGTVLRLEPVGSHR